MRPAKLLIIEDNPSDIFILQRALAELGEEIDVEILPDGETALKFVHHQRNNRNETHPCVILLDLHLPKHDGLEVLRALREEPALTHIRVVVMTTLASPQEEAELLRMGANYRTKPMGISEFEALAAYLIALCKDSLTQAAGVRTGHAGPRRDRPVS